MLITATSEATTHAGDAELRVRPLNHEDVYSDWSSMFDRDPHANPFQHPDYVLAELDTGHSLVGLQAIALTLSDETECHGVGILVPKLVRTGQVGGIGPGWTMRGFRLPGGSFLTSDDSVHTQSMLLSAAIQHCAAQRTDFLLIEDLDEKSHLSIAVNSQVEKGSQIFAAREIQPRWRIEFPTNPEDYWKTFSGRTRRAFRTRLKKFGETRLVRITNADQIPAFLSAAHAISKQSWQSRQFGLRIRNDDKELRRLNVLANLGFLRSYLWEVEGQPAAFALCHQHAGYFRYEEIAYCAQFGPLSPGETMLQQIVEDLYQHNPPSLFDFGGGDAEYKRRFGNLESRSQTIWLVPPTWRAGSSLAYLNGCRTISSSIRTIVRTCGLATKARQWLRYGGRAAHSTVVTSNSDVSETDTNPIEKTVRSHE